MIFLDLLKLDLGQPVREDSVKNTKESLARSLSETNTLQILHSLSNELKQNMRFLDRFLTTVMVKQITPRHREFADFITSYIQNFPGLAQKYKELFKQFIQLQYGDTAQALIPSVRETRKNACLGELFQSEEDKEKALHMLFFINEFAHFCDLLSKPENHIKKLTGEYVVKEAPLRTEADMVGEMRRELVGLPNFTAYAKIMQAKYKITTFALPAKWPDDVFVKIQQEILEQTHKLYSQKREDIENQIRQKQTAWQKDLSTEPLPGRRH